MFLRILLFSICCLFFSACGENKSASKDSTEKFAENANDKDFQDQHETPKKIDFKANGITVNYPGTDGEMASAYFLKAKERAKNHLFVIHEWYGLNDHIKKEAERLRDALPNTNVMALDLYDGKVATKPEQAGELMKAVSTERAEAIIKGAMAMVGKDSPIATIGWCFGGGWSLKSSILAGEQGAGCVIYYGAPVEDAKALEPLQADVLGIFAEKDGWITPEVVNKFDALAKATGKNFTFKQFDADHAFANPSSPRYVEKAAQEANAMALDFLAERLK